MSESMKAQTTASTEYGGTSEWPKVTKAYDPPLETLEDKEPIQMPSMRLVEPEEYKYVHVVIGILVVMIIGAYFIGGMVVENKMMKVQIEQLQRGLR